MIYAGLIVSLMLALSNTAGAQKNTYPDEWWKPLPDSERHSWEIPPQAADRSKGEVILSKRNELGKLLSNFAETHFTFDGVQYKSVEGFWQMLLYPEDDKDFRAQARLTWPFTRAQVGQMIGFDAKHAGEAAKVNMQKLGINWVTYKGERMTYRTAEKGEHYKLIREVMRQKLLQNKNVKQLLLKTGDLKLLPDHDQGPGAPPAWRYFEIWMEFRAELKK